MFAQLNILLQLYVDASTPEERINILKMGDKAIAFVSKVLEYAEAKPQFSPAYMGVKNMLLMLLF